MKKHERITKGLHEIGAAWAMSRERYVCTWTQCRCTRGADYGGSIKKMYHIHPDTSHPYEADIITFDNLDQIAAWIRTCKECEKLDDVQASNLMEEFWASLS